MKNGNTWNYALTVIIPLVISIASFLLNARNTGKKIEEYKFALEKKQETYSKVIDIYKIVNNLADYIVNNGEVNQIIEDGLNDVRDILAKNDLYCSKRLRDLYCKIFNNMNFFSDVLDNIKKIEKNYSDVNHDVNLEREQAKKNVLKEEILSDLQNVKKTIRSEYQIELDA